MAPEHGDANRRGRPEAGSSGRESLRTRWSERAGSGALVAAVFAGHLWLARRLDALGLFERFNTLFGADPNLRLESIRRADTLFRVPHPGLSYLLGIPIRALGGGAAAVLPGHPPPDRIVRGIALGVAPLASALTCLILLRMLRRLGFPVGTAFALTVLSAVSMSAIIFGSVPETYAVSAFAIALACALFLRSRERGGFGTELAWGGVGLLAAGITITNIAPVAVLYFFRGIHRSGRPAAALTRALGVAAIATLLAVAAGLAADEFLRVRKTSGPGEREWIARYIVREPLMHYVTFPTAIVNGIAPPTPTRVPGFAMEMRAQAGSGRKRAVAADAPAAGAGLEGGAAARAAPDSAPPPEGEPVEVSERTPARDPNGRLARLTLQPSHRPFSLRNLLGIVLVASLGWAALRRGGDPALTSLARASLVIVAANCALHGFWGGETFLYSQHWHVPLMLLVAALAAAPGPWRRATTIAIAAAAVAVAANNIAVLSRALSAFGGP